MPSCFLSLCPYQSSPQSGQSHTGTRNVFQAGHHPSDQPRHPSPKPHGLVEHYNTALALSLDSVAPLITRSVSFARPAPWFTPELRRFKFLDLFWKPSISNSRCPPPARQPQYTCRIRTTHLPALHSAAPPPFPCWMLTNSSTSWPKPGLHPAVWTHCPRP